MKDKCEACRQIRKLQKKNRWLTQKIYGPDNGVREHYINDRKEIKKEIKRLSQQHTCSGF